MSKKEQIILNEAAYKKVREMSGNDMVDYGGHSQVDASKAAGLFIAGAEWQREQCDRDTTFYNGMQYHHKQLMKEATSTEVLDFSLEGNHPHVNIPLSHLKYHSGDKVKVLIMKDDDNR